MQLANTKAQRLDVPGAWESNVAAVWSFGAMINKQKLSDVEKSGFEECEIESDSP